MARLLVAARPGRPAGTAGPPGRWCRMDQCIIPNNGCTRSILRFYPMLDSELYFYRISAKAALSRHRKRFSMARTPSSDPTPAELEILNVLWETGPASLGQIC